MFMLEKSLILKLFDLINFLENPAAAPTSIPISFSLDKIIHPMKSFF